MDPCLYFFSTESGRIRAIRSRLVLFQMHEVGEGTQGSIGSSHTFEPAHQDGVESLTTHRDVFFSGSRDCRIKKWDLASKRLLQVQRERDQSMLYHLCYIIYPP